MKGISRELGKMDIPFKKDINPVKQIIKSPMQVEVERRNRQNVSLINN